MKLYGYGIIKVDNNVNKLVCFSQKVKDVDGLYENMDTRVFWSPWPNYLPKSSIGQVYTRKDFRANIEYLVYLTEKNKDKAIALLEEYIEKEIEELKCKLREKRDYKTNCVDTIEDIDNKR